VHSVWRRVSNGRWKYLVSSLENLLIVQSPLISAGYPGDPTVKTFEEDRAACLGGFRRLPKGSGSGHAGGVGRKALDKNTVHAKNLEIGENAF
jgi:hypothetical protein